MFVVILRRAKLLLAPREYLSQSIRDGMPPPIYNKFSIEKVLTPTRLMLGIFLRDTRLLGILTINLL